MKKIIALTALSIAFLACSKKENDATVDQLISNKNVAALQDKKATLQSDLSKIEEALAKLDVKKEEALVEAKKAYDLDIRYDQAKSIYESLLREKW
jgi:phosphoglycerate-specific signal transduction histidine kinase